MENKTQSPLRILHVTQKLAAAGVESFIMNHYEKMDPAKVQFDFFVLRNVPEFYDEKVQQLGGRKYTVDREGSSTFKNVLSESRQLYAFLKKHPYSIVHIHYTTPLRAPLLLAAKMAGVPVRIYHAHSAEVEGKSAVKLKIYDFLRNKIPGWATDYLACSHAAARWIFPESLCRENKVVVARNGIDLKRFAFSPQGRSAMRKEMGLENRMVLLQAGRFTDQKNQLFSLQVLQKLIRKAPDRSWCLLFAGSGEMEEQVKEQAALLGLQGHVRFLGVRADMPALFSAADAFLMPSLYEGLPVAAIEAQAGGLPCLLSENITEEAVLTSGTKRLPLESEVWAQSLARLEERSFLQRKQDAEVCKREGYDLDQCAQKLQSLYLSAAERKK